MQKRGAVGSGSRELLLNKRISHMEADIAPKVLWINHLGWYFPE
jgi:hypothetical protein